MSLYALSESCYDFFFLFVCLSLTKLLELYQKDEVALFKHFKVYIIFLYIYVTCVEIKLKFHS